MDIFAVDNILIAQKISEYNLSALIHRLFHEDFSIVETTIVFNSSINSYKTVYDLFFHLTVKKLYT